MSKNTNDLVQFLNNYEFDYVVKATDDVVNYKPITTGQIKKLLMYEGHEKISVIEDMLDDLISGCVITEGFDVTTLNIQDRFDLLLDIRRKSKGDVYSFTIKCPKCGNQSVNNIDLNELNVIPYDKDIDRILVLSDSLSVEMGYVTRADQKMAFKMVEDKNLSDNQKIVEMTLLIYAYAMKTFRTPAGDLEDVPMDKKLDLLDNLPSESYDKFQEWFKKSNYGTEFKYKLNCQSDGCNFEEERDIPVTDFFS